MAEQRSSSEICALRAALVNQVVLNTRPDFLASPDTATSVAPGATDFTAILWTSSLRLSGKDLVHKSLGVQMALWASLRADCPQSVHCRLQTALGEISPQDSLFCQRTSALMVDGRDSSRVLYILYSDAVLNGTMKRTGSTSGSTMAWHLRRLLLFSTIPSQCSERIAFADGEQRWHAIGSASGAVLAGCSCLSQRGTK